MNLTNELIKCVTSLLKSEYGVTVNFPTNLEETIYSICLPTSKTKTPISMKDRLKDLLKDNIIPFTDSTQGLTFTNPLNPDGSKTNYYKILLYIYNNRLKKGVLSKASIVDKILSKNPSYYPGPKRSYHYASIFWRAGQENLLTYSKAKGWRPGPLLEQYIQIVKSN